MQVSVIIPCYNSGIYLPEALQSIELFKGAVQYEVIIINDGSTDKSTLDYLQSLSSDKYTVIHQENKGASGARNTGVLHAKGKYLLLLDSDNKIRPEFISKGIEVLNENEKVGVVYGDVLCFGEGDLKRAYSSQEFDITTMLAANQVDMCCMMRKQIWADLGGLDENLSALEDWDFFLRIYSEGWQFHYVKKIFFEYRIREGSLISETFKEPQKVEYLRLQVYKKHVKLLSENYIKLVHNYAEYRNDQKVPLRTFVKLLYRKYLATKKGYST